MLKKLFVAVGAWLMSLMVIAPTFAQNTATQWGDFTTQTNSAQWIAVKWAWTQSGAEGWGLIKWVKNLINWVLWLLALVALCVLLYAGFQMVTAAGDAKQYDSWFTILKQAAVWLIFIGVSWLIVSFIFWVIQQFTTGT